MIVFLSVLLGVSIIGIVLGVCSYVYYDVNNRKLNLEENRKKKYAQKKN